jgi:hypothetical protein
VKTNKALTEIAKAIKEMGGKISFTKEDQKRVPGSYRDARGNTFGGRKSDEGRNSDWEVEETDPTADRKERNADEAAVEEDKKDFSGPLQKKLDSDIAFQGCQRHNTYVSRNGGQFWKKYIADLNLKPLCDTHWSSSSRIDAIK